MVLIKLISDITEAGHQLLCQTDRMTAWHKIVSPSLRHRRIQNTHTRLIQLLCVICLRNSQNNIWNNGTAYLTDRGRTSSQVVSLLLVSVPQTNKTSLQLISRELPGIVSPSRAATSSNTNPPGWMFKFNCCQCLYVPVSCIVTCVTQNIRILCKCSFSSII